MRLPRLPPYRLIQSMQLGMMQTAYLSSLPAYMQERDLVHVRKREQPRRGTTRWAAADLYDIDGIDGFANHDRTPRTAARSL